MKQEDLIKKLENIKTPEIKIQNHKQRLKMALLTRLHRYAKHYGQDSGYFKKKPIMFWTKRLVPASVALALILVVGFTIIQPKLQIAKAMEIAKNDPQIQKMMEEYGVEIKQVKLQDGKAYVLLTMPEEKMPAELAERTLTTKSGVRFGITLTEKGEPQFFSGSVAEIDLKTREVKELKKIGSEIDRKGAVEMEILTEEEVLEYEAKLHIPMSFLTEEEKTKAIKIAQSDSKIQEMIPDIREREIIVKPMPSSKLYLEERNGEMTVASVEKEGKRINVIFKSKDKQDIITVNPTIGIIEGVVSFTTEGVGSQIHISPAVPEKEIPTYIIKKSEPNEGITVDQKKLFAEVLEKTAQENEKLKEILGDNDYEILEVVKSKQVISKTETEEGISETAKVGTATIVLEKESINEKYQVTIDLETNTVKSIEKE